jgi:ribosome biogenesis GTPase A
MAKSLAAIEKSLAAVDIALYLLDARAPRSSLNPSFG